MLFSRRISIIAAATEHLLAGGSQQDGVFKLGRVAAFGVAQRRIWINDTFVAQVLQSHQVLGLTETVEPATAECQRSETLIDHAQQLLRLG